MRRIVIVLLLAIIAAVGLGWLGWRNGRPAGDGQLVLYGNVDIREVDLGFRVAGRVAEMRPEEGDAVKAGQVVAVLDRQPYLDALAEAEAVVAARRAELAKMEAGARPQEIAQARAVVVEREASLRYAEATLKRREELLRSVAGTQAAYDEALAARSQAEAALRSAQEALRLAEEGFRTEDVAATRAALRQVLARQASAETQLRDTEIMAPADGVILTRVREPGAIVGVGQTVYTLSLIRPLWVRAYVGEPDLGRIYPGMAATVTTDTAPDKPYQGRIGFIAPTAEFTPKSVETPDLRTSLVYRLRIVVTDPDAGLRQGMPVTVRIDTSQPRPLRPPTASEIMQAPSATSPPAPVTGEPGA